ncbi:uncharacterized protein LOC126894691 isoform X2 [Daktulosphaira vitifoliae]|uniref:uncharacterized protein LOC126894691 isoform X2 n=1 Tax=Daktulosphaira vitifoliae TaxID=58002 RepID=UPI0021AAF6A6|nr:uncharacterized protein LOC126894691 isoform X2 [Daktulosphaira vitifoliae]
METYFVYNGNLGIQNSVMDSDDIFVIEQPFESYKNDDHHSDLQTTTPPETRKRTWREWTQYETKILMDMYRRNATQVGPAKKFKSKKEMFNFISKSLSIRFNFVRTAHQCENRYKTVVNHRKVGKFEKNLENQTKLHTMKLYNGNENLIKAATASVSADHDYNGKNSVEDNTFTKIISNEWSVDDTKLLMELYKKNISKVGLHRTFRTKIKMFEFISKSINETLHINRSAEQCINRYKTIMRRKHNKLNDGSSSPVSELKEDNSNTFEISSIDPICDLRLSDDQSDEKESILNEWKNTKKIKNSNSKDLSDEFEIKQETELTRTLREIADQKKRTKLKIAAHREEAEERRHQETMALIKQIVTVLL